MRIAFVYDVPYPWHVGGIESMNFNEAQELAKWHDVHYFTTRWPGMKGNEFVKDKIRYHAYVDVDQPKIYPNGRRSVWQAFLFKLSLFRMFRYRFDVVITNQFPILHMPVVRLFCAITGAKLVIEVAEAWDEAYWKKYLGAFPGKLAYLYQCAMIRGAGAYITISSKTTSELMRIGIGRSEIREFAPAIDDRTLERIRAKGGRRERRIIFSGRLIKEKRVGRWISLFASAASMDKSISGVIIGKGPERDSLERQIRKLGLEGRLGIRDFFGNVSEFHAYVRDSSVMLNMSEREGLGIIAIEGIALGTPVLLPTDTPLPKEVKDMCVVADENDIPSMLVKMCNGKKEAYLKHKGNLNLFRKSKVRAFYESLFREIGASQKQT